MSSRFWFLCSASMASFSRVSRLSDSLMMSFSLVTFWTRAYKKKKHKQNALKQLTQNTWFIGLKNNVFLNLACAIHYSTILTRKHTFIQMSWLFVLLLRQSKVHLDLLTSSRASLAVACCRSCVIVWMACSCRWIKADIFWFLSWRAAFSLR